MNLSSGKTLTTIISMKPDIMLDLETLGSNPGSVIVSIGAVKFSPKKGITDKFYIVIDPQSCVDVGLTIQASTVMWWLQQGEESRLAITKNGVSLKAALFLFSNWVGDHGANVWGNGATFDNVLLADAYRAASVKRPWSHTDDRCYRTIKNLNPGIAIRRSGTQHNALDDAISQANHLIQIFLNQP